MKSRFSRKPWGKPALAWLAETIGVAAVLVGVWGMPISARGSLIIDSFDSYPVGALFGQGGWTNTVPGDITDGITVASDPGAISSPNVALFDDHTNATLGIRYATGMGGVGTISFYARPLTNNLSNSSGFDMRLNSDIAGGIVSPDAFFQVGFSPSGPDIHWIVPFFPAANGSVSGVVTTGTWYRFYMDYDISHTTLGDTNRVDLQITDVATSTVIVNQSITFPNQNGGRTFFGSFDFLTGSVSDPSMYQVDNLAVPESSTAALVIASGSLIVRKWRRRST